jgi:hypothetical protein
LDPDTGRRLGGPACEPSFVAGLDPVASGCPEIFDLLMASAWPTQEVVETRRLELLTLSLQRRCSAS